MMVRLSSGATSMDPKVRNKVLFLTYVYPSYTMLSIPLKRMDVGCKFGSMATCCYQTQPLIKLMWRFENFHDGLIVLRGYMNGLKSEEQSAVFHRCFSIKYDSINRIEEDGCGVQDRLNCNMLQSTTTCNGTPTFSVISNSSIVVSILLLCSEVHTLIQTAINRNLKCNS